MAGTLGRGTGQDRQEDLPMLGRIFASFAPAKKLREVSEVKENGNGQAAKKKAA
jgi:hypothetical protein